MLPFVRGVDLSGNDFKVSPGPPSRRSLPLQPAPVSASCPVCLRAQYRSRLLTGPGGAPPGLGFPAPNRSPRPLLGALTGRPRPGQAGVDAWVRSHARVGLRAPTRYPGPGDWALPGLEWSGCR